MQKVYNDEFSFLTICIHLPKSTIGQKMTEDISMLQPYTILFKKVL